MKYNIRILKKEKEEKTYDLEVANELCNYKIEKSHSKNTKEIKKVK